ncbi:hypothetical protein, partial [Deinococcus arboris]|uniref:hypothetical protein n=1 Tax=Deinococcus arboris TaxID=2682977 RepID=UPI001E4B78B6
DAWKQMPTASGESIQGIQKSPTDEEAKGQMVESISPPSGGRSCLQPLEQQKLTRPLGARQSEQRRLTWSEL